MLDSNGRRMAITAFVLLVACCLSDFATARNPDWRGGDFAAAFDHGTPRLLEALEGRLPLEPRFPFHAAICATLRANLTSAAFASPSDLRHEGPSWAA